MERQRCHVQFAAQPRSHRRSRVAGGKADWFLNQIIGARPTADEIRRHGAAGGHCRSMDVGGIQDAQIVARSMPAGKSGGGGNGGVALEAHQAPAEVETIHHAGSNPAQRGRAIDDMHGQGEGDGGVDLAVALQIALGDGVHFRRNELALAKWIYRYRVRLSHS